MALLAVGDKAPAFKSTDQDGKPVSLSEYKGQKLVVYFYPKDDTPGCTKEACSIRDGWSRFRKKKVAVLGVSVDDAKSHRKFVDKFSLPFRLAADTDKSIVKGTNRVTYLIDEKGKIAAVWPKVKPEGHADEILEAVDGLKSA